MPQSFRAEFELRYHVLGGAGDGSGRTLEVAINQAVIRCQGVAPDPGAVIDLALVLGPGHSEEIQGIVDRQDNDLIAIHFDRFTPALGRVFAAASGAA